MTKSICMGHIVLIASGLKRDEAMSAKKGQWKHRMQPNYKQTL